MNGTPFGHYQLLSLVGEGGMGQVYRAFDTLTNRIVALKVLPERLARDPSFRQRFLREANLAAGLSEPHVVPIHRFGEIDGQLYVDMRLIEGRDLQTELSDTGAMGAARTFAILDQIASALHAAHASGLVHRDVKPSNIRLTDADFAYLIDFGIARGADQTALTSVGSTIGTFAYMAPERFGAGDTDQRSDVYALACVLYECLTGYLAFPGVTLEQQVAGHLMGDSPRPSKFVKTMGSAVDEVVAKGLAKNPDDRYQTCPELMRAFAEATSAARMGPELAPSNRASNDALDAAAWAPTRRRATPQPTPRVRRMSRRFFVSLIASVVVAVTAAVVFIAVRSDSGASESSGTLVRYPGAKSTQPPVATPLPLPLEGVGRVDAIAATLPEDLRASGTLVVGVNVPYTPNEYVDANGRIFGFDVDLMNAVAGALGLTPAYRQADFSQIIPSIQGNVFDVGMSSFTDTKERERFVDFVTYPQSTD